MGSKSASDMSSRSEESQSKDGEGEWLDVEPEEEEQLAFHSFFSDKVFHTIGDLLKESKETYSFDFPSAARKLGLDFHEAVKLVNYLRSFTKQRRSLSLLANITKADFEADDYLLPVLENDAVLFTLDDILQESSEENPGVDEKTKLLMAQNKELEEELEALKNQFQNYRLAVQETLDKRWGEDTDVGAPAGPSGSRSGETQNTKGDEESPKPKEKRDHELYFESYAGNGMFD